MTYNSGQLSNVFPYLIQPPKWLIIGGPADADEAATAVARWPGIRVIGAEPNHHLLKWQLANKWPCGEHPLLPVALSDHCGTLIMKVDDTNPRGTSAMDERGGDVREIPCLTIEQMDTVYGPFEEALLWLDVEGHEYEALCGAEKLFQEGRIFAANVEILEYRPEAAKKIEAFFSRHNFGLVRTWNSQPGLCEDRIYVRS